MLTVKAPTTSKIIVVVVVVVVHIYNEGILSLSRFYCLGTAGQPNSSSTSDGPVRR